MLVFLLPLDAITGSTCDNAGMTAPVTPRDAATVVVLRDAPRGLEVYLVKRSRMVDFMAGAHVFPGGKLDEADCSEGACGLLTAPAETLRERLGERLPAAQAAGFFVAAIRETFEEAGLLLGRLAAGRKTDEARAALAAGADFASLVSELDAAALVPWVRWVTPELSPKRFDARFFLARAPEGQEARVDGHEATEGMWIAPAEALARWRSGEILFAPATARSIELLASHSAVDGALAAAAVRRPPPVLMPVVWNEGGRRFISLPGDPRHPAACDLGGAIRRLAFDGTRFVAVDCD
jgi:8-oxo-dGTP pyrophosphatase MutT (NUDIX family)